MFLNYILIYIFINVSFSFHTSKNFLRRIFSLKNMNNEEDIFYKKEYYNYLLEYEIIEQNLKGENDIENIFEERKDNFKLFKKNYDKIIEFNKENNSYKLGFNQFMDTYNGKSNDLYSNCKCERSDDLMKKKLNLYDIIKYDFISVKQLLENPNYYIEKYRNISDDFIWDNSIVSPVKNQERCGSCWAFSSTGSIEANMRINNYSVSRLSEQQLVDCSIENNGCNGGLMHIAFDYCIENRGLTSNELYPYNASDGNCQLYYNKINSNFPIVNGSNIKKYNYIVPRSVIDIMASLKRGPIAIALDASPFEFRFYKDGIIDINPSNNSQLNHAVLLTGYEKYENGSYWIIQNSWGEKWGNNGYVKIKIQNGNGILLSQLYGVYPFN